MSANTRDLIELAKAMGLMALILMSLWAGMAIGYVIW